MTAGRGRRATPWAIGGGIALVAIAVATVVVLATQPDDADPGPAPDPPSATNVEPTAQPSVEPSVEPTSEPTLGHWPELEFAPDLPTETFSVEEKQTVLVNGIQIVRPYAAAVDDVSFVVRGDGFSPISFYGPVGTVIEIPGWGLLGAMEIEGIEPGGRPDIVVHFEAQTDAPLEVTPSEP